LKKKTVTEKKAPLAIEEGGPSVTPDEVVAEVNETRRAMKSREKWEGNDKEVEDDDDLERIFNIINRYRLETT